MADDTFSSTLSAREFVLAADAGFEPAGFVMGSSVCLLGRGGLGSGQIRSVFTGGAEVTKTSSVMRSAKIAATERLEDDVDRAAADGVIGATLAVRRAEWAGNAIEVMISGTAVRHASDPHAYRAGGGRPFLSGLSGQELWALLRSGYRPAGLVFGSCVYRAGPGRRTGNRELKRLTQAFSTARELAVERMREDAAHVHGSGIVGMKLSHISREAGIIEFRATGTAIAPLDGAAPPEPPATVLPVG